ncbi:MAG TPA: CHAP domain-containing protein, partial [Flavobacteriales bacterium]|nr:CHAP domain-containing protein [Flavobacteriales bacterium]
MRKAVILGVVLATLAGAAWWLHDGPLSPIAAEAVATGAPIDSLHGVIVYHNDGMSATHGRNTVDGYNVGLRYQCVEFVKRYYLEHYHHRMPNSYGNAV